MTDRKKFLAGRYIATLSTENDDGSSHLTAVWYLFEEGAFYIPTGGATRKAENVSRKARAAIMVDSRCRGELRGVAATGGASVISGDEALRLNGRIHSRYLTAEGLRSPRLGEPITSSDDVTIRVQPERWTGWNMGEFFGDLFGAPELVYPLDG